MTDLALILAAGKGTRMNSELPKCLHRVAGAPMVSHVLRRASQSGFEKRIVVVGHGAQIMIDAINDDFDDVEHVLQSEQLGTAHAVKQALDAIQGTDGNVIVLYGDTPLVSDTTLIALNARARDINGPVVLGFHTANPGRYGRLLTQGNALTAIREAKDATNEELEISLCNSGVLACPAPIMAKLLPEIDNQNAAGEYYLTDIVELAQKAKISVGYITCDEAETMGVNTPSDLRLVNASYQEMRRAHALAQGIEMLAPETVYYHYDTEIGNDVVIEPYVVFGSDVTIENNAHIRAFSHIEGAHIGEGAEIGPYARLRPGAEIGGHARVGNFVEIKKSEIHQGAKINHLSYIGDAIIGEQANIGAGTITCNYDGVFKHMTQIGSGAFIGTNTSLVAPVTIGKDAMTAAGSVITGDVEDGDLAIARAKQNNKSGLAKKMMARLRALKSSKT